MIDRSDAVNLARSCRNLKSTWTPTESGVAILADAVLAMDEYIRRQELQEASKVCDAYPKEKA